MEDYSINISVKKKIQISPMTWQKLSISTFSHYKSLGTISCHSNQSSYPTGIKNTTCVEANVLSMYAKFLLHPLYMVSEKKIFLHFYENQPFLPPRQPIKFTDLDKSHMKCRGLLNKHFCKKKKIQNIPNETEKNVNFLFSHYKSKGTISCHSNQSSYPIGTKNTTFCSPYL